MVRPSLASGLVAAHPNLSLNDVICRKHLKTNNWEDY
jgi:hypothetical protein